MAITKKKAATFSSGYARSSIAVANAKKDVAAAPPKTYSKLDCVGTDGCKASVETRHLA